MDQKVSTSTRAVVHTFMQLHGLQICIMHYTCFPIMHYAILENWCHEEMSLKLLDIIHNDWFPEFPDDDMEIVKSMIAGAPGRVGGHTWCSDTPESLETASYSVIGERCNNTLNGSEWKRCNA